MLFGTFVTELRLTENEIVVWFEARRKRMRDRAFSVFKNIGLDLVDFGVCVSVWKRIEITLMITMKRPKQNQTCLRFIHSLSISLILKSHTHTHTIYKLVNVLCALNTIDECERKNERECPRSYTHTERVREQWRAAQIKNRKNHSIAISLHTHTRYVYVAKIERRGLLLCSVWPLHQYTHRSFLFLLHFSHVFCCCLVCTISIDFPRAKSKNKIQTINFILRLYTLYITWAMKWVSMARFRCCRRRRRHFVLNALHSGHIGTIRYAECCIIG